MKIFCDLDGTLIDVAPRHYRVYTEAVGKFDGTVLDSSQYWELKRKKTKWPIILALSDLPPEIEPDFLSYFIEKIEDPEYLQMDYLFDGAYEALEDLSKAHSLFLVSLRRNQLNLHEELRGLGIYNLFEKILSGHSESDGYDKKIELIRTVLAGDQGVVIGDTEADVITGQQLGLLTVAVRSGIRDEAYLEKLHPDYLLSSFSDINEVKILA